MGNALIHWSIYPINKVLLGNALESLIDSSIFPILVVNHSNNSFDLAVLQHQRLQLGVFQSPHLDTNALKTRPQIILSSDDFLEMMMMMMMMMRWTMPDIIRIASLTDLSVITKMNSFAMIMMTMIRMPDLIRRMAPLPDLSAFPDCLRDQLAQGVLA